MARRSYITFDNTQTAKAVKAMQLQQLSNAGFIGDKPPERRPQQISRSVSEEKESYYPIPAKVLRGSDLEGYEVELYQYGYDNESTGIVRAYILQGNAQLATVTSGTNIMIYKIPGGFETIG